MYMKYLGDSYDIHTSGIDLVFPHHENSIAIGKAVTGKSPANNWLHNELVMINGKKTSRVENNEYSIKNILKKDGHGTGVGDEGGFAPDLKSNETAIQYIMRAIKAAGYKPGINVGIALDAAASEFYKGGKYVLASEKKKLSAARMIDYYEDLIEKYPILSIEDGLAENDWDGWRLMTDRLEGSIQIVGDDIFVTNPKIFSKGIEQGIANSILIKLNQIGTVTETLNAVELAKQYGYTTVISHRSGETDDTFIADLAVGVNSGQIKTGSMSRSDRVSKYNQLIRIEEELGVAAFFSDTIF